MSTYPSHLAIAFVGHSAAPLPPVVALAAEPLFAAAAAAVVFELLLLAFAELLAGAASWLPVGRLELVAAVIVLVELPAVGVVAPAAVVELALPGLLLAALVAANAVLQHRRKNVRCHLSFVKRRIVSPKTYLLPFLFLLLGFSFQNRCHASTSSRNRRHSRCRR